MIQKTFLQLLRASILILLLGLTGCGGSSEESSNINAQGNNDSADDLSLDGNDTDRSGESGDESDIAEGSEDEIPLDNSEPPGSDNGHIGSITDTDGDGVANNQDIDDDNDGVGDEEDAFPLDDSETLDTDNDGLGNNQDIDDDNDGVDDEEDAFPLDDSEALDTDNDGLGNNQDIDDDNDGINDEEDAFPLNTPPSSLYVTVVVRGTGSYALTDMNLGVAYRYYDLEGDRQSGFEIRWLRDGEIISGANDLNYTVVADDVGKYLTFEIAQRAETGDPTGSYITSNTVFILNSPPQFTSFELVDSTGGDLAVGDILSIRHTYLDADGDEEGDHIYRWYLNGRIIDNYDHSFLWVTPSYSGHSISVIAQPVALTGTSPGNYTPSGLLVVRNSAPTADDLNIRDINRGEHEVGDTLLAIWTYDDLDGDRKDNSTPHWYRNGETIIGAEDYQYIVSAEDLYTTISFKITPIAQTGVITGTTQESEGVLILNSGPIANFVDISEKDGNAIVVGSILEGNYEYFDMNDDLEGISVFQWFRNDNIIEGANANTYVITPDDAEASIHFSVMPVATDGTLEGITVYSQSVNISNSRPFVTNVSITRAQTGSIALGDVVHGNYDFFDYDGDVESVSTYRWLRNGVPLYNKVSQTYSLSVGDVGHSITFEVTPVALSGEPTGQAIISSSFGVPNDGVSLDLNQLNGENGFVLSQEPTTSRNKTAVSGAGDINNDGNTDLIVGVVEGDGEINVPDIYIVYGNPLLGAATGNIALEEVGADGGFKVTGFPPRRYTASYVCHLGDINGDNIDDISIGLRWAETKWSQFLWDVEYSSVRYLIFGKTDIAPTGILNVSSFDGTQGFRVDGITKGSSPTICAAGDVNSDGIGDILIGDRLSSPNGIEKAGQVHVVFGAEDIGKGGVLSAANLNGLNGFSISGYYQSSTIGSDIRAAGDFNGDSIDDFIIAGDSSWSSFGPKGYAFIVFGDPNIGSSGSLNILSINGVNGVMLLGEQGGFGGFVSGIGDFNGDGLNDVVASAPEGNRNGFSAGESYIFFGTRDIPDDGIMRIGDLNGANGFVMLGETDGAESGVSLSSAGDFNGDGLRDLIIGAHNANTNALHSGDSYLIFGSTSFSDTGVFRINNLTKEEGIVFRGTNENERSGSIVRSLADINGDGLDDIIIGTDNSSKIQVVFGRL